LIEQLQVWQLNFKNFQVRKGVCPRSQSVTAKAGFGGFYFEVEHQLFAPAGEMFIVLETLKDPALRRSVRTACMVLHVMSRSYGAKTQERPIAINIRSYGAKSMLHF
jgi:hypothetical protein